MKCSGKKQVLSLQLLFEILFNAMSILTRHTKCIISGKMQLPGI
jgi:hypothetical protein